MKPDESVPDEFAVLLAALAPSRTEPLLVSRAGGASRLVITQFDGGRDAQYFLLDVRSGKPSANAAGDAPAGVRETIGYQPQVAGTTIVYDVTGQTLQGKARPFVCEVDASQRKVFALLPVQIEAIAIAVETAPAGRSVRVEFLDAQGERLRAVLPFHLQVEGAGGRAVRSGYWVTAADGRFLAPLKPSVDAAAGRIVVRSQLTGQETAIELAAKD